MNIRTYIVDSSNKISISHQYVNNNSYQLRASDNIVEIDIARGTDDPSLFSKYTSIAFGSNITRIAPRCCYKFTALVDVTFSAKIQSIGSYAFFMCLSLNIINIPDATTTIEENAFLNCTSLQDVIFPSHAITIKDYAFSNSGIQEVDVIVNNQFGANVFSNCASLQTAKISGALTDNTFSNCGSLNSIEIGDRITSIPSNCFYGCSDLAVVSYKNVNAITSILSNAFSGCTSLASFSIKDMLLTYIGPNAFYSMPITTLELPPTITSPTQLDPNFLAGTSVKTLKFLGMSYDAMWQEHTAFSPFGSLVGLDMEIVSSDGKKYALDETGLKKTDITAVVIIVAMGYNGHNTLKTIVKDIDMFNNEINKAYAGKEELILARYILSDPGYPGSTATATQNNIDKYFLKAVDTGADLLLFLFSDHGLSGSICIYDNTAQAGHRYDYSYAKLYTWLKKFKYAFVELCCCYPNSIDDAIKNGLKDSSSKILVWASGYSTKVTLNSNDGHKFAVNIHKRFNASYTWTLQFNTVKDIDMGASDIGTVKALKYNYNEFPESSPVYRIDL